MLATTSKAANAFSQATAGCLLQGTVARTAGTPAIAIYDTYKQGAGEVGMHGALEHPQLHGSSNEAGMMESINIKDYSNDKDHGQITNRLQS